MGDSTSLLLYLDPMSAVLARVAYRSIQLDYRKRRNAYNVPGPALIALAGELHRAGFRALATWVAAYAWHLSRGRSTAATKQWIVRRARWASQCRKAGRPWARIPSV